MSDDGTPTLPQTRLAAALAALGFQSTRPCARADGVESVRVDHDRFRVSISTVAMGTRVSIIGVTESRDRAQEAIGRAFAEMHRLVALLNRHDASSAVSVLNGTGALDGPPPELAAVLRSARRVHALSDGVFDITVKPLVDLLRDDPGASTAGPALSGALELVDMASLHVTDHGVRLGREGMGLTLDGIAKGYVVDCMASVLNSSGLRDWLIDAGGDIRASGRNERGQAWRVGVQDPDKGHAFPDVTDLGDGAVATSGGYESFFDEDQVVHHIVDSKTGRSPTRIRSSSFTAPTASMADALATASMLLPPSRALALAESLPGCSCLLLDTDGHRLSSSAWRSAPSIHH